MMPDDVQDDGFTAAAWHLRDYWVLCLNDRFDTDMGKSHMTIHAFGPKDASNQALEIMKDQGWGSATVLRVEAR